MTYTKQIWHDEPLEDTPISAARLDYTEQGILDVSVLGPTATQKNALVGTSGTPDTGNAYVTSGDPRMTDARAASSITSTALTTSAHITDVFTNRPTATAGLNGARFFATDKMIEWQCISAAWVIINILAPEVVALPTSPIDQQECIYIADATNGVKWHLRYRAASASASKWEPVNNASPLTAEVATSESTASTTYVDLTTVGPSITLPLAGDYLISFGSYMANNTANNSALMAPKLGGAATADADCVDVDTTVANLGGTPWRSIRRNGLAAAAVVKLQHRAAPSGTATFSRRNLEVRPLRVG